MTALARRSDVPGVLTEQLQLAQELAKAGIVPTHLQRKPENILALMYAAQSVDIPLWQAVQGMQVISGKVGISADLCRALILRAGHIFRVEESTETAATVVVIRKGDTFEHRASFTIDDAKRAGLTGGSWNKYPKAMLIARATTLVARNACADVLAGMAYTPEELGADVDEDGRVIESREPSHAQLVARTLEDDKKADRGPVDDDPWSVSPWAVEWLGTLAAAESKEELDECWINLQAAVATEDVSQDEAGTLRDALKARAEAIAPVEVEGQVDILTGEVVEASGWTDVEVAKIPDSGDAA
jgi:hypothetical protein